MCESGHQLTLMFVVCCVFRGNVNPIGIRSCYDEGKRLAESLCFEYYRQHGVQIRVARIFNTYGPRMLENDGRVVSNFIVQALSKKPITIYGDGAQTRRSTHAPRQRRPTDSDVDMTSQPLICMLVLSNCAFRLLCTASATSTTWWMV
jgi:hypothetical protein